MLFLFTNLRRAALSMSLWQPTKQARWLLISVAYLLVLTTSFAQVVISEVYPNGTFELQNNGNQSVDLSNYWICDFPSYERLTSLSVECGALNLDAGESVTLSGFSYSGDNGELGLYATNSFGSSSAIRSYVDWGAGTGGRAGVAASAGIWTSGERVSAFGDAESLQFDGAGNSASDWSVNTSPAICADNATTSPATTARYRVTFNAFWSGATHPTDFPGSSAHFSGLIGLSHSENISLFELGDIASPGIVNMAETGGKSPLTSEIDAIIASGAGLAQINGGGVGVSPGSVSVEFDIDEAHPLASVTTMIAPSPDWFVGVRNLNLFENGDWLNKTVTVSIYDAGSDSGSTFTSPNQATNPRAGISMITGGPLATNGIIASMGTLTFERIDGPATDGNTCSVDGGTLTGGPFNFCVDGTADNIPADGITLSGNSGTNNQWVVTDPDGNILGLPPSFTAPDFDAAGAGVCLVWNLAYEENLTGLAAGNNVSQLVGCYSLSNSVTVTRVREGAPCLPTACMAAGGTLTGGSFSFCVGDGVADNIAAGSITLSGNSGSNSQWIVTDDQGNILGLPPMPSLVDFDGAGAGTCLIWHLAYDGAIQGLAMGENANNLSGCFSLSNSITVNRDATGGVCDAPSCEAPSEGTTTFKSPTRLRLKWDAIAGAKGYVIQLRLKGRDNWAVSAYLRRNFVRIWAIPNRDFEYRIKTICSNGESEYSPIFEFSTKGNIIDTQSESRNSDNTTEVDIDLRNTVALGVPNLQVAPNPFFNELNVSYEVQGESAQLSIYHISGQKVFEQVLTKDSSSHTLPLGALNGGIFLMTIQEEGHPTLNRRLVKRD